MMHGHYHDNIQHHVQKALHGKHAKISKHLSKKKDGRNPDHPGGVSWMHRARLLHPKQKGGRGQTKKGGKSQTKKVGKSQKKKLGKKKQAKSSIQRFIRMEVKHIKNHAKH